MKQIKDLEFRIGEKGKSKGKFNPENNVDILFPYLKEIVEQDGAVNLQKVGTELNQRFFEGYYRSQTFHNLYTTAELVSSQFGLQSIRFLDAVKKCYPDVDETRGFNSCRDAVLLYAEESELLEFIRKITLKTNIVRVELKEDGAEE